MTATWRCGLQVLAVGFCFAATEAGSQPGSDGPQYENGTDLVLPADYRSWPFIGAGLGMTYDGERGTQAAGPDNPRFTHAFVNPAAYAHFMRTGSWPDGTVFMLEFRASQTEGSINRAGRFATQLTLLEAEVKDARFPDGWAFYVFGRGDRLAPVAKPLAGAEVAPCVECHSEHAAVERTFVQFYPHLLEVAREKGTLKPGH
jgi:hypothetical protein